MELLAPLEPFETRRLAVGDGHELHVALSGARSGRPVCVLHGGPGSGSNPTHRRLFDPRKWLIVQIDQRGCGRSAPHGSLEANTTPHLVADIEAVRADLGIERWTVMGGSWGSALALAYAAEHTARVKALALYGLFLGRRSEIDALYAPNGAARLFLPEAYADFLAPLPEADRIDPIAGYGKLFSGPPSPERTAALDAWTRFEKRASMIAPPEDDVAREMADEAYVLAHSLIEQHYFANGCFMDGAALLREAGALYADLPMELVNGRYDLVTPLKTAHALAAAAPKARLTIVEGAGHSVKEPPLAAALMRAIDRLTA